MNPPTRAARRKLTKMAAAQSNPLALVCGDDDFAVKQRAKQLYEKWSAELGGMDHEIIEDWAAWITKSSRPPPPTAVMP